MDFRSNMISLSEKVQNMDFMKFSEEATKTSIIMPFFKNLGYDVFDSTEFHPEFIADWGKKKAEKVDYAIIINNEPVILIECKPCSEQLDKHISQISKYYASTPTAKYAILTNGIIYRFYSDLEKNNLMDGTPFLEIDLTNMNENDFDALEMFRKHKFNIGAVSGFVEEMKYRTEIGSTIFAELKEPSDEFISFILRNIYNGKKNQKIIEKFKPIVKKCISESISNYVKDSISSNNDVQEETDTKDKEPKIVTTMEELEAFFIVRSILVGVVDVKDVIYKDTESYFGILYKNTRHPICRINLDRKNKYIYIPDELKNEKEIRTFTKYQLKTTDDIYDYRIKLIEVVKRYL